MTDSIVPVNWNDELNSRDISDFKVGDQLIDSDGHLHTILRFGINDQQKPAVVVDGPYGKSNISLDNLALNDERGPKYRKLYDTVDAIFDDAVKAIALSSAAPDDADENDEVLSLSVADGEAAVRARKLELQQKQNKLEVMQWVMTRKMTALRGQATLMKRQLKYTQQVISLMELFMGVYEMIVTLREGKRAPASAPINIRQLVLYMDEEVGTIQFFNGQRGIDFQNIEEFDRWLLSDQRHIDTVIPEAKGIVVLRPTRQEREYSPHFLVNIAMQDKNKMAYLLIRNGERLYRIYTNIAVGDQFFPSQAEMDEIYNDLEKAGHLTYEEEKARDKEMSWRYKAALIQGLIERTDVFSPLNEGVSLFNPESFEKGDITLIRDAEIIALPDGRLSFSDWRKAVNATIGVGSRVVFTEVSYHRYRESGWQPSRGDSWWWRYGGNYYNNTPPEPSDGVYVVVDTKQMKVYSKTETFYKILYSPRYSWRENAKRQAFYFSPDDDFVLNYDAFDMDDIEYYVNNRLARKNYLRVIPQMFNLRDLRIKELAVEGELVKAFARRYDVAENLVWDALEWWKRKNKLQRPLSEDESKAWRMIRRHLGVEEI